MQIVNLPFEKTLIIDIKGEKVKILTFKMQDGNIKFGIDASRRIKVDREEVHKAIKQKAENFDFF